MIPAAKSELRDYVKRVQREAKERDRQFGTSDYPWGAFIWGAIFAAAVFGLWLVRR